MNSIIISPSAMIVKLFFEKNDKKKEDFTMQKPIFAVHPFEPICSESSEQLILGSFPSVRSRELCFYYAHPQNRFWRVLSAIYGCELPKTDAERAELICSNRLALWDVLASCRVSGSADQSITEAKPNDVKGLLRLAPIKKILVNGRTAEAYYNRFLREAIGMEAICLPSTSPANAAWSMERLVEVWGGELKRESASVKYPRRT